MPEFKDVHETDEAETEGVEEDAEKFVDDSVDIHDGREVAACVHTEISNSSEQEWSSKKRAIPQ